MHHICNKIPQIAERWELRHQTHLLTAATGFAPRSSLIWFEHPFTMNVSAPLRSIYTCLQSCKVAPHFFLDTPLQWAIFCKKYTSYFVQKHLV